MNQLLHCVESPPEGTRNTLAKLYAGLEGMISFDEALLLYGLAKQVKGGGIVEIGSYRGLSTVFLARGSMDGSQVPVYAVDPHREFVGVLGGRFSSNDRTAFYKAVLAARCGHIAALINLSSEQFSSHWKETVSLLWIDGDHSYRSVRRDFDCWNPHVGPDGLIAFHDAVDDKLGPYRLISELLESMNFEKVMNVEGIVVLRKGAKHATTGAKTGAK